MLQLDIGKTIVLLIWTIVALLALILFMVGYPLIWLIQNLSQWPLYGSLLAFFITIVSIIFVILFSKNLREKWIVVIKEVPANIALVFRFRWPSIMPWYGSLRSGKILYLPFFFQEEAAISLKAEIVDEGKLQINSRDAQLMLMDFQLQSWVRDDNIGPIQYFLHARGPEAPKKNHRQIMKDVVTPFLHAAMNLITSGSKKTCSAEALASASRNQLEAMSQKATGIVNDYLRGKFRAIQQPEDGGKDFGIEMQVSIQAFEFPPSLARAKTAAVAASLEADEVKKQAEGYKEAARLRAEGLAKGLESISQAASGANPTWWLLAESLGPQVGQIARSFIEQKNASTKERKESKSEKKEQEEGD